MNPEKLRHLADRIGAAEPSGQKPLFEEAVALFAATPEERARWRQYLRARAFHELAVAIFTAHFTGWGFQFGMLAGPAPKGIANIWRAADAQSSLHQAATPALALLRGAATESANALDARTATHCPACGGRGWFVTAGARKQICRHECAAATPSMERIPFPSPMV